MFQDEVDINTNPEIGAMWMPRGEQAEVETPGNNEKRYLAGSLNWRSGDMILTEGERSSHNVPVKFMAWLPIGLGYVAQVSTRD